MDIIAHHFCDEIEMSERPVWITGAGGLIGNYLVQTAPKFAPPSRVRALTRAELDLEDFARGAGGVSQRVAGDGDSLRGAGEHADV